MEFREIGTTGMKASVLGMGAEHLDGKPYDIVERTIHAAIDNGINIMDVFMPGEEIRRNIGKALKGKRDKMMLQGHICSVDLNDKYDMSRDLDICKRYFEDLLRFLDTDYIDFGMMFFMDSDEIVDQMIENGIIDYIKDLKKQGVIRAIGASSHHAKIARRLVEMGDIDLLMFSINAAYDLTSATVDIVQEFDFNSKIDPSRMDLYKLCVQNNVSITVMKALCAGKLLSAELSPFKQAMTPGQCVHYALTRPAVASVLVGYSQPEHVAEAMKYFDMTEEEKDYSAIINANHADIKGSCVFCSHCQPCPMDIDIASVNKYLDIALLDKNNISETIKKHYECLGAHGSSCIACGSCEQKCPFFVPIIDNMAKAAELFGK